MNPPPVVVAVSVAVPVLEGRESVAVSSESTEMLRVVSGGAIPGPSPGGKLAERQD